MKYNILLIVLQLSKYYLKYFFTALKRNWQSLVFIKVLISNLQIYIVYKVIILSVYTDYFEKYIIYSL